MNPSTTPPPAGSAGVLPSTFSGERSLGLLTKKELAGVLKCSKRHIERLQVAGKIPFVKLSGRMIRYRLDSILEVLNTTESKAGN